MKSSVVQIVFVLVCTVLAAALQDMLPSFGGAKPPVLAMLVLGWVLFDRRARGRDRSAASRPVILEPWIPAALLAGAFEDALSGFPTGCASGFLLLAGAGARLLRPATTMFTPSALGLVAAMVAAPCHELWLGMWGVAGDDPSGLVRFFASTLPAAPTGAILFALLPRLMRRAGFHGPLAERSAP